MMMMMMMKLTCHEPSSSEKLKDRGETAGKAER